MLRTVTPELLDALPPDSAAARHSRRDLRWFNAAMATTRWWRRTLPPLQHERPGVGGIELGAGDGQLARRFGLAAIDLTPVPATWPQQPRWHQADITAFDAWGDYPIVCANLFLHHLSAEALRDLGVKWDRHATVIVACEPWRARAFQPAFAVLCLAIRAHAVSRHDGHVSIAAGFRGDELPVLLGLSSARWEWRIQHHRLGTYRMVARRRAERLS